ncbi:MAG: 50S ribosomal protein L25 [bacterium]|nr:50S ribosomal protein L25 [bacterium]
MKLKAEIRTKKGKREVKRLRNKNKIPVIVYGHGEEPVLLQVDENELKLIGETEHFTLDFGKKLDVIVKDVQWDPVTSKIIHVDFQHLRKGEKVKVRIPIVFEGIPIGVKEQGGILEHILSEVEVECLPEDIQEEIKVDVSNLKIGDSIHLKDLPPIKGKFTISLDSVVATVLMPRVFEEKPPEKVVEEVTAEKEEKVKEEEAK